MEKGINDYEYIFKFKINNIKYFLINLFTIKYFSYFYHIKNILIIFQIKFCYLYF